MLDGFSHLSSQRIKNEALNETAEGENGMNAKLYDKNNGNLAGRIE